MPSQDYDIDIMIPESEITAKVNAMSRDISKYYAKSEKLVVVGLLRGSFMIWCGGLICRLRWIS
jgi:hypoxanthine phosphoribosyltransferase